MQRRKTKTKKNDVKTEEWSALEFQCIENIAIQEQLC
jgi:hypothetical protein